MDEKLQKNQQNQYDTDQELISEDEENKNRELFLGEWGFRKIFGVVAMLSFGLMFFEGGFNTDQENLNAVKNRISYNTQAGETLFDTETNANINAKDFEITGLGVGEDGGNAKMLIWDFNLEDGDEVQVFVDGKPAHEPFILTNDPVAISIPANCIVTIKGVKDGGGGISYAVKFPQKKMTIFNVVPVNGSNSYKLIAKP